MDSSYLIFSILPISGSIIGILVNVMSRLSKIETDIKWIKKVINDRIFFDMDIKP